MKILVKFILTFALIFLTCVYSVKSQSYISLSFDDPNVTSDEVAGYEAINDSLLLKLKRNNLTAALFVCGKRVDSPEGNALINSWNEQGHSISNHSYDHRNFGSSKMSFNDFKNDFEKNLPLIESQSNYKKRYRFPYLKEGNTKEKIDSCREFLKSLGYTNGYVSIDASDWYIDQVLRDSLKANPETDLKGFKEFYIYHILERSRFYDSLAAELTGRKIKHNLLLHYNFINALFLEDLIIALKENNFVLINTEDAYTDKVYESLPNIIPAGESIIWSLAKESGRYNDILRYPAEDSPYEEEKLKYFLNKYSVK